jgi:DNA polymerase-3 subunit delta'
VSEEAPEADRHPHAPHPRHAPRLHGQEAAERAVLDAWNGGRPPHAWLLAGPRGVGKATLAWRIARFLLTDPPRPAASLEATRGHPALPRIAALAEPTLLLLRRPWDGRRLATQITVEEARRLPAFLALSAADGGARVVIVDAADDLNRNAANALLKTLEEPPPRTTLLLVSHAPARLLPTIRSRCRTLRMGPLDPPSLAAAVEQAGGDAPAPGLALLAEGSAGAALTLAEAEGLETYAALADLLGHAPMDRARALAFVEPASRPDRIDTTLEMLGRLMHRAARAGALGPPEEAVPGEAAVLARLAPDAHAARGWAEAAGEIAARAAHGRAVNVDPGALLWDALARAERQAREA